MKTKTWNRVEISAALVLALTWAVLMGMAIFGGGCGTFKALGKPIVAQTNVVERVVTLPGVTNTIVQVVTNVVAGAPVMFTNTVVQVQPPVMVTNTVTNVVFSVNPALGGAIETTRSLNSTLNPTPSAPLVEIGLLGVSALLGWFARMKTVKAARAAADANAKNEMLETLIAGVEAAKNDDVKAKIEEISTVWGTRRALDEKVQEMTRRG